MKLRARACALVVGLILVAPKSSWAGPEGVADPNRTLPDASKAPTPEAVATARSHYNRGIQLYEDGDYKLAVVEFERAYEIAPNYQVLYNIAQVCFQLNNYAKALQAYRLYVTGGGDKIPAARRTEVETAIKQLVARTAKLSIATNVPGAEVSLDDATVGTAPINDILVDTGQHRVTAVKAGRNPATKTFVLAAGDQIKVDLDLTEIPVVKIETPREKKSYTWIGWVATGVAAAGALTTGILSLFAYTDYRDARNSPADISDQTGEIKRAEIDSKQSKTNTLVLTTAIIGGATVVTGAVTLYFTLKESSSSSPSNVRVNVAPQWVSLSGTF